MEVKPGYKQTEVGVIPEDWDVSTISQAATISVGKDLIVERFSSLPYGDFQYPVFSNTVSEKGLYGYYKTPEYIGDSVTVVGRGVGLGTAFVRFGGYGAIGRLLVLFPNANVSAAFLAEYINHRVTIFVESGGIPQLPGVSLGRYKIPLPPTKAEQEAIAGALSDADSLIGSLEQLVAKKRQIKHGAMQQLLTGQKRLPGFTGQWETYRFDQLFTPLRNASNSRSELSEHGDVAYVHYGDIHTHPTAFLNPSKLQTYIPREKLRPVPRLADGDLLMADASEDTTAIGKAVEIVGLGSDEAVAGLHTMPLRGDKSLLADGYKGYIQFLPKVRSALVRLATGVSVYGITKSGVKAIEITIPKPDEQTAIATILSDMEAEIAGLEAKLAKARQVKQGMMQELLTGKTRLVSSGSAHA